MISYIDFGYPSIRVGIDNCIQKGATKITVVPILLIEAGHAKNDIPLAINEGKRKYPQVTFHCTTPFGVQHNIIDMLIEHMNRKRNIKKQATIVIVARGSSDHSIIANFTEIIRIMEQKLTVSKLEVCYLAAQKPTFTEGVERALASSAEQIFIIPYLLFPGILMSSIEEKIQSIDALQERFILCDPIGLDERMVRILADKVNECIE